MKKPYDLLVTGGTCLTDQGRQRIDVAVRGGCIAALGDLGREPAEETLDVTGLHVLPGVIDPQVHFREPGFEHKEDLACGSAAAVLGGVTAVLEMPNTRPTTTSAERLDDKLARARGRMWCDHGFFVGAEAGNADELGELECRPGCCGVKVFMGSSTGDLLVEDDATLRRVLRSGTRRVAVHCEDEPRLRERRHLAEGEGVTAHAHPLWRDEETAWRATQRLLALSRETGRRVHVLHVTTAEEMELLATHRDLATVEVPPQHLTLVAPECYDRLGNYARMNPPIRDARHHAALWRAVATGLVDVLGSDHAPHTREEKEQPYPDSPSGMPGVQTLVPLMLDHVHHGRLTLERFVELSCSGPARVWGIEGKGHLVVGHDGDLTIVDLAARRRIENRWIASRCGWTPFDGMEVTGWPRYTVIRGRIVMRDDELQGEPSGAALRFEETLSREDAGA